MATCFSRNLRGRRNNQRQRSTYTNNLYNSENGATYANGGFDDGTGNITTCNNEGAQTHDPEKATKEQANPIDGGTPATEDDEKTDPNDKTPTENASDDKTSTPSDESTPASSSSDSVSSGGCDTGLGIIVLCLVIAYA